MAFLIDGYNLLHAIGRLTARDGKKALEGARRSLLLKLGGGHGPGSEDVTVVFDAGGAPAGLPVEGEFNGIHVKFAQGQTADDMIEDIIKEDNAPRSLTVVSDDHRIQNAARRRACHVLGCLDYYEKLEHPRSDKLPIAVPDPAAKPEGSTQEEKQRWLDAFAEIDDDPFMRDGF